MTLTIEYYDRDERLRTARLEIPDNWEQAGAIEQRTLVAGRLNQAKLHCERIKSIKPTHEEKTT